jgi:geranylgeranyl diphosphate synthase type II
MTPYQTLQQHVEDGISNASLPHTPAALYQPVRYVLGLGGKRIRPVLALMATEMFDGPVNEALQPAIGLEIFHNFTLVHDDIMDEAEMRRGYPTVHCRWDTNNAILSGDLMHVIANEYMSGVKDDVLREVLTCYNQMAMRVCEGQQLDMDFEEQDGLTVNDYLEMIQLKTANLLAAALQLGGIIGRADEAYKGQIRDFGLNLGMAFQIQDDLLDTYGQAEEFGKQIGGDILAGKRTYLYLKAMELATPDQQDTLQSLMQDTTMNPSDKVAAVKQLFSTLGVPEATEASRERYYQAAMENMAKIPVQADRKQPLLELAEFLMHRRN